MVKHWNRLLRWVMESLSREILKTQLDMGLARLFQMTFELRAWTRGCQEVPSNVRDSVILEVVSLN